MDDNENPRGDDPQGDNPRNDDTEASDDGQAIQINENTIDDPDQPEPEPGDDHLHSRTDVPKRHDQAIQINENTINEEG